MISWVLFKFTMAEAGLSSSRVTKSAVYRFPLHDNKILVLRTSSYLYRCIWLYGHINIYMFIC